MMQSETSRPRRKYGLFFALGIVLIVALALLLRPWQYTPGSKETPRESTPPASGDTSALVIVEPPRPAPEPTPPGPARVNEKVPRPARMGRLTPRPAPPVTLTGKVDSWEDWNSSFSDTVTRTYSAIFDSARLDTASGGRLVFAASGRGEDLLPVKQLFCIVDSVKPLVKYTFPGVSVDFGIGVGFASGVSFKGALEPRAKSFSLHFVTAADERFKEEGSIPRNQFVVALNSPPGYTYILRTGIECFIGEEGSERTRIYFTHPAKVEFRRMMRFQSLLSESGDTLFILTANPASVTDLLKVAPRSFISAVFVPVKDPSESESLTKEENPRLQIHVSIPRHIEKSFVILNDSLALVEKNVLDPDFKRTAQLKLKALQLDRIGLPRVTNLVRGEPLVEELKLLFVHYSRLAPP